VPPHDRSSMSAAPPTGRGDVPDDVLHVTGPTSTPERSPAQGVPAHGDPGIVDWHRTGRRLRRQAVVILVVVVVAWLLLGFRAGGPSVRSFAELLGLGVLLAVAGEVVIVGGAAFRGMLTAGERGDRLASSDVSLLPPQVSRRLRRNR
jgi:hypothetical protein